ncbi:MAG: 23S rRNA (adenine(2030)-N(6))-methyltransferase RlmJ [Hyphomicrobiaceae bacterium]|nr:23S rRNA (adenine(2030)-N(6))-methyltransferase RlmJ [Hyphomicrobiaceae bacterium]
MNYRHAYHAGNFADVLKHLVLTLVIEHLKLKPQPFRVIDTHAGIGLYDLAGVEAGKTGEWRAGIARLLAADFSPVAREVLEPYLSVVGPYLGGDLEAPGMKREYPGSPLIARDLMRPGDALVLNELHPEDRAALETLFRRDKQTKVLGLDGYTVIKSTLPPKERRGVLLVDPPFEESGEFDRLISGMHDAFRRFAGGTQILWYPVKDLPAVDRFRRRIAADALAETLLLEIAVRDPRAGTPGLAATGVVVVNPPYTLHGKLAAVMPELLSAMAGVPETSPGASYRLEWLVCEKPAARI